MSTAPATGYDELQYGDLAFFHTHPCHLAVIAALRGLPLPPVEECRFLEVGCGTGFNLLAMSQSLPKARFVGIDLSERQIEYGRAMAREIGTDRVELHAGGLESIGPTLGQFDYIVAHGVFSWIPPDVQTALLKLIHQQLAPHGIAYISYNTYPGWHFRGMLRDMLKSLEPADPDPHDRLRVAKERVMKLLDALPEKDTLYEKVVRGEFEMMAQEQDYYVFHEHLAGFNQPMLFAQFVERIAAHGLQFVAESRFGTNSFAQLGDDSRALEAVDDDLIQREQYHDFRHLRYFRQSVLAHTGVVPSSNVNLQDFGRFWIHPRVVLEEPLNDLDTTDSDRVQREEDDAELAVSDPFYRLFLRRLQAAPDVMIRVYDLRTDIIEAAGMELPDAMLLPMLAKIVISGYSEGVWHLYATKPTFANTPGEYPKACRVAQIQAKTGAAITNRTHRTAKLPPVERDLLARLDGRTSRAILAANSGLTAEELEAALTRLARLAVLES